MEDPFVAFVLGQLRGLERLGCRAMFGGYGLYRGPTLFGIVSAGRLYLKTDDSTVSQYTRRGIKPFRPEAPDALRTYYEVPADVLGDRHRLADWSMAAAACAEAAAGRGEHPSEICNRRRTVPPAIRHPRPPTPSLG